MPFRHRFALLPVLLLAPAAHAWNVTGHEVVAAVAYDVLAREHPRTLAKAVELLHHHPLPEFEAKQIAALNAPADVTDKVAFLAAARFPDDVKMRAGIKGYNHPTWHYIDFPLSATGDPTTGPLPEQPNALSALDGQLAVLRGDNPPADKAVAICWTLHLVGDLHQPLHAVSIYAKDLPKGDRGGNDTFVTFPGRKPTELHGVWDGLLGKDAKFGSATTIATELLNRPAFAREKLPQVNDLDPGHWAQASFDLAKQYAYLNGAIHGGSKDAGYALPADYGETSKAVAERQVVLAGYRLAAVLNQVLGD